MALTPEEIEELFKPAFEVAGIDNLPLAGEVCIEPPKVEGVQNSGIKPRDKDVLVPHLTPAELDRNVPSYGKNMVIVRPPAGVSNETFYTLLSNAYALYVTVGNYDADMLVKRTGMTPGVVSKVLSTSEFKYALRVRGVQPNATGLSVEQDYALLILTDPSDGKTLNQKLKLLNISWTKFRAWMKEPVFKAQMDAITADILQDNTSSIVQLERLAGEGDLGAIKYKHELNGLYNPNKQNNIDIIALMGLLFEIVTRHVEPGPALIGISEDLKEVAVQLKLNNAQIGN